MFDITIIGAGPGGYTAAIRSAQLGARVALIEKDQVGGVCLNRGCIPTKALIASANAMHSAMHAEEFGVSLDKGSIRLDMQAVQKRKQGIVETLRAGILQLLKSNKVELIAGAAELKGNGKVSAAGRELDSKNVLLATGSGWIELANLKPDRETFVTSDEALDWGVVPDSVAIVGGGVVGCEFACMLQRFGAEVAVIEALSSILPRIEAGVTRLLTAEMKKSGIKIYVQTKVEHCEVENGMARLQLSSGQEAEAQKVIVAVGRRPVVTGLGLENAGVGMTPAGFVEVNENFKTSADGMYAIGDLIGGDMLAHTASNQGVAVAEKIFKGRAPRKNTAIPLPIFTSPEIGSVGKTEEELKKEGVQFRTGKFPFLANGKALAEGETSGQVIVHADEDGKLLGVHIVGPSAATLIAEAALALEKGLTVGDILETIHAHPTLPEAFAEATADVFGCAIHKVKIVRQ